MIVKDVESEQIAKKILLEEKLAEQLYPEKSVLDELREKQEEVQDLEAESILKYHISGNIMKLAEDFLELVPIHFDSSLNWWKWDSINYYWRMIDETDILVMISKATDLNIVNSKIKSEILTAIKIIARSRQPKEVEKTWIQFDKQIWDIKTGDKFPASSRYFVTNPIPFKVGVNSETPKFDKLFREWVHEDNLQNLYEIIAYCLLPDYPIERIACLLGAGANGKSTFIKILYTFLGLRNITTTSLEVLSNSRFETGRLYKKLACIMAETNLSNIENSQLIKKLVSGKDPVSLEFKNKGFMDFINYAKMIIATNNLPPTEDKTDGFYRRWLIIDFPNQFEKEIDVLSDIPLSEYENLARKCLIILDNLLKERSFTNEGNIAQRKAKYEEKSNPFDKFWSEFIDDSNPDSFIPKWEFEKGVNDYMKENHLRTLSDRTITKFMRDKQIQDSVKRTEFLENGESSSKTMRIWLGVKWK